MYNIVQGAAKSNYPVTMVTSYWKVNMVNLESLQIQTKDIPVIIITNLYTCYTC